MPTVYNRCTRYSILRFVMPQAKFLTIGAPSVIQPVPAVGACGLAACGLGHARVTRMDPPLADPKRLSQPTTPSNVNPWDAIPRSTPSHCLPLCTVPPLLSRLCCFCQFFCIRSIYSFIIEATLFLPQTTSQSILDSPPSTPTSAEISTPHRASPPKPSNIHPQDPPPIEIKQQ